MTCRYCNKDSNPGIAIPESFEKVDISVSSWACRTCAIERGIFCVKHDWAHQDFGQGKHACWHCIVETRQHLMPHSERVLALVLKLLERLPQHLRERFFDEGEVAVAVVGGDKSHICFEFLVREIAIHKLDPGEFVNKYLLGNRDQEHLFALLNPFPKHVGA